MSLWAGYWKGKTPCDPILFELPIRNIHEMMKASPVRKIKTVGGNIYGYDASVGLRTANGTMVLEDFGAGETIFWAFPLDSELHIIMKGEAKLTYSLEGNNHTTETTVDLKEGDCYIIPRGARMTWKVSEEGPLVKFCCTMPGLVVPERSTAAVESIK